MRPLPPATRDRVVKVAGMLGSSHDGEVLAAARQLERLRQEVGVTWAELIQPPPATQPVARPGPRSRTWRAAFPRLSEKQRACLKTIADRVLTK